MNFLKRQVLFSRRENHLSHHEDFFNIVKLVTDEASNQFSPLFSENPLKHSRLKSHLCASTGVCSLLLLITHLRLLHASRSRNLSLLFAYRATSSPFYAHNKAPPELPRHLCASTGVLEVPGVGELHEFCFF